MGAIGAILVIKIVLVVIKDKLKGVADNLRAEILNKDKLKGVVDNLRTEILNQESISFAIAYISMIVFFVVLAVCCLIYFVSSDKNLIDTIKEIPFWWAPLALMLFSYVVLMPIEDLILTWRGRDVSDSVQSEPEEDC